MRSRREWKNSQSSMKQLHCNQELPVAYNIDTIISTHENYIYQNIKMEFIISKKLENVMRGKSRQFTWMIYTYWIKSVLNILEEKRGFEKT